MQSTFKHFENSLGIVFCSVRYHSFNNRITIFWKNTAPLESISQVRAEVIQMIRSNHCTALINDFEEFYTASSETLALLIKDWDMEVIEAGIRYIAHIYNSTMELPAPESYPENIRFFNNKLDAVVWIDQQQQQEQ